MEIAVLKNSGEDTGRKVNLSDEIFGIEPNDHAIYLDVKQFLANQRQGTHKSKERAEIAGSTKKIKRQKGTGTARAGSIKSPVFRGGGRVFGPQPRNYSFKLNKKLKQLARKSALAYKAKDQNVLVLEDFNFEAPKTKDFINVLNNISVNGKKTLVVLGDNNKNVILSGRNIQNAKVTTADSLNTYDVLNAESLVLSESSIEKIENLLK
ncbi:LSU ribosomal protein L4P [Roseivirga pacifica]|uniref:Large ribosomal subunit protein uL4 n=1 Tax=Roseivirga pacifica TaxID=1267423 RepID=A0A1I0NZ65_9BACT|nr:50S ribosomal protein L4 [Roseivirga pacifica]MCO6360095.1 50S ribosomal protein L4 [Roseivirga pacifica]MCO6367466.1 50S ribosomal protein L4 [Roseivirga pacifica]MCO6370003.1 50S ribosomal protein L4 [Roseivirga pacifica]MCO6375122.1 50S ribosomal protein L4 [Roseivirga pacifica]MCO6380381.1 50S ribosomal protein L4 [Roseivirga pacifica]